MRKIFIFVFALVFAFVINSFARKCSDSAFQPLTPIERQIDKLNISIDPRLELLCAVQAISDYDKVQRNNSYYNNINRYFAPFTNMEAVSLTNKLAANGFSHDAPIEFMLCLNQHDECQPNLHYSNQLINRAKGSDNLDNYQKAIHEFAVETRFNQFWKQNELFYNQIIEATVSELSNIDWISALEEYFGSSNRSYNIIISPLLRGGYGPSLLKENGEKEIYACLPLNWKEKDSIPYLDIDDFKFYLWHEFSHSFVNPEIEKYPKELEKTSILFKPLENKMAEQAYRNWGICVNEHIIRAINIRLIERYIGPVEADQMLSYELKNHFVYIRPILNKLKEYERLRVNKKISFSEFVPELLNVFDSISKTNYDLTLSDFSFNGPINDVFQANKIAVIYPTNSRNSGLLKETKLYTEKIHGQFFKNGLYIPDSIAISIDLTDYGLVVYGTINNNLFLKKYQTLFPFKIEGDTIIADIKYFEPNIKLITCLPNPQNKKLNNKQRN
ncbi:MAG: DUF4932 domain-containing protein, partial [Prevotella sp.]|nr:DUF4932 domain-containing protein [Prevotella sp.]